MMDNRSLKSQALSLVAVFPADKDEAQELYRLMGELLNGWLLSDGQTDEYGERVTPPIIPLTD